MKHLKSLTPKDVLKVYLDPFADPEEIKVWDHTLGKAFSSSALKKAYVAHMFEERDFKYEIDKEEALYYIRGQRLENILPEIIFDNRNEITGKSRSATNEMRQEFMEKLKNPEFVDKNHKYLLLSRIADNYISGTMNEKGEEITKVIAFDADLGAEFMHDYISQAAFGDVVKHLKVNKETTMSEYFAGKDELTQIRISSLDQKLLKQEWEEHRDLALRTLSIHNELMSAGFLDRINPKRKL